MPRDDKKRPGKHVFIVTYGRSGSTLLSGLLNACENCHLSGENGNFLFHAFMSAFQLRKAAGRNHVEGLDASTPWYGIHSVNPETYEQQIVQAALEQLEAIWRPDAEVRGFKEIRYLAAIPGAGKGVFESYLKFLERNFANSHFIFLSRNTDDIIKSKGFLADRAEDDLRDSLRLCDEVFASCAATRPNTSTHIDYDDVVDQTPRLLEFFDKLGLQYERETLREVAGKPHSYAQHAHTLRMIANREIARGKDELTARIAAADMMYKSYEYDATAEECQTILKLGEATGIHPPLRIYHRAGISAIDAFVSDDTGDLYLNTYSPDFFAILSVLNAGANLRSALHDKKLRRMVVTGAHQLQPYKVTAFLGDPVAKFLANANLLNQATIYGEVGFNQYLAIDDYDDFAASLNKYGFTHPNLENPFLPLEYLLPFAADYIDIVLSIAPSREIQQSLNLSHDTYLTYLDGLVNPNPNRRWYPVTLREETIAQLQELYRGDYAILEQLEERFDLSVIKEERGPQGPTPACRNLARQPVEDLKTRLTSHLSSLKDGNQVSRFERLSMQQISGYLRFGSDAGNNGAGTGRDWVTDDKLLNYFRFEEFDVGYLAIPKVASTSLKWLFLEGYRLEGHVKPEIRDVHTIINEMFREHYSDTDEVSFRFTIVRDPIKRFISGFRNKVICEPRSSWSNHFRTQFSEPDFGINRFVENFEKVFHNNTMIFNHFVPQSNCLPDNVWERFRVYRLESLPELAEDLSRVYERKLTLPHKQARGFPVGLGDLEPASFEKLLRLYRMDYDLLQEHYTIDEIRDAYHAARIAKQNEGRLNDRDPVHR